MILIKPAIHSESQSELITPFIYNTFPTSLGYLAAYLRKYNNVLPKIVDENITQLDRSALEGLMKQDSGPKIIGMTVITISSSRAYALAKLIKEIDKDYLVVLGGIHPTVLPDEALGIKEVDAVIRGEGEKTLSEFTECAVSGRDFAGIRGLSFRNGAAVTHNPARELIDLSTLPPFPYDLFEETYDKYRDFGTVISSRGCPFNCIFCSQRAITGQKYRTVDNARVLEDIRLLIEKYNQKKIWFMDDNFLVNKNRAMSLMDGIIANGFNKKAGFVAEMRGESVTQEILDKMKEANFLVASFGMETSSQRLLDLVNKNEKVDDNIRAIEMAHRTGIGTSATFIFGLPTETRKERLDTARLTRKLPLDDARFNIAVPYPGTKLYDMAKKEGRLLVKPGWSNFNVQFYMFGDDIAYVPEGENKYRLMYDTFMANLLFSLRLRTLINFIKSPVSGGMVLTLPKGWYRSPKEIVRLLKLFAYIFGRFCVIVWRKR
ncbi:MAG: radical SAM protein [Candidatus Omnitrophota bacterium]